MLRSTGATRVKFKRTTDSHRRADTPCSSQTANATIGRIPLNCRILSELCKPQSLLSTSHMPRSPQNLAQVNSSVAYAVHIPIQKAALTAFPRQIHLLLVSTSVGRLQGVMLERGGIFKRPG